MAELLVFDPMTSSSAGLVMMEISTTTHSISYKPIIPSIKLYIIKMMRKASSTTAAMTKMKAMATKTMTLINLQKRNKRLGVAGTVALIVIRKK